MLYDGNNPILHITDVDHIKWSGGTYTVAPREYSALAFRINGTATLRANGRECAVNTNDILYLPQNMGYQATYTDTEIIVVHFVTQYSDRDIEIHSFDNCEQLYKAFLQLHALWQNKELGFNTYAMGQLYTLLGLIREKETKDNVPRHFLAAVSYINANYRDNSLTVDRICAQAGISATVFRQLFKKHYQKTPVEYITTLRLEYARNLISGGMGVENAACESGFNDSKYFARVVKKHFGCTPRALRAYGK